MDKKEIMRILKKEAFKDKKNYQNYSLVFELNKKSTNIGIIRGEYYEENKLVYRGSLVIPLELNKQNTKKTIWEDLKVGENKIYALTLDAKKKTVPKVIKDFFKRSFEEGRLQDFIPSVG